MRRLLAERLLAERLLAERLRPRDEPERTGVSTGVSPHA